MVVLSERFVEALQYAHEIHREHMRKGTDIPYITHLMSAAALTLENGGNEDQAIAALLHDAVEDCGGLERLDDIREKFGEAVAQIVADCTDSWVEPKSAWRGRKEAYVESLRTKPESSLLVALADKTHNARSIVSDLHAIGERHWDRFNADRTGMLWYYRSLADAFQSRLPGALCRELQRNVDGMHAVDHH